MLASCRAPRLLCLWLSPTAGPLGVAHEGPHLGLFPSRPPRQHSSGRLSRLLHPALPIAIELSSEMHSCLPWPVGPRRQVTAGGCIRCQPRG